MWFSEKFPRAVLYSRRIAMEIGLISPNTIISMLALKLYVRHNRYKIELSKAIRINEENTRYYYGYSANILNTDWKHKPNIISWSDEIQHVLKSRELQLINCVNDRQ